MPTRSSSITIDMNNVTADGRVKVSASRVRSELQPGENVQLHDSLEDVWLAASVDSMSNDTYFFAVDWTQLDATNRIEPVHDLGYISMNRSSADGPFSLQAGHVAKGDGILLPA